MLMAPLLTWRAEGKVTLKEKVANWDGKSKDAITLIYEQNKNANNFIGELIRLCSFTETAKGATWLLKHALEKKHTLTTLQQHKFLKIVSTFEHWETKLHALQTLPYIPIPKKLKGPIKTFVHVSLTDENKFIRAWAYNSYYLLACQIR